ncbi:unnamed protein product [Linum trigynum]|uniref:Chitin-binding type-1 domain-containing protein n=1 Tax=Linum trigynum TaxID=586398 RepID=A0AAV2GUW4_9ROSI
MVSLAGIFASTATFTTVILCQLNQLVQPCGADIVIPGGTICGTDYYDGSYVGCDANRCCSNYGYCGDDRVHCVTDCWKQCREVDGVDGQLLYNISTTTTTTTTNVVNATHNEYYDVSTTTTINGSWPDGSLLPSSSCATSLSGLPQAQRNKYALAAFGRPRNRTVTATTATTAGSTYCGRCLKLINLKTGVEAKVRVVHERNVEGLELGSDTFNKLRSYGAGSAGGDDYHDHHHHLVLKYQFENCQD